MLHPDRGYQLHTCASLAELADMLTRCSWVTCQGLVLGAWTWLNDSFAGRSDEWAAVRTAPELDGMHEQCESVTFSAMDRARAEQWLSEWYARDNQRGYTRVPMHPHVTPYCAHCA